MATTEKNKTAGKNSTELTVHEIRVLAKSWKAMKAMPEVTYTIVVLPDSHLILHHTSVWMKKKEQLKPNHHLSN